MITVLQLISSLSDGGAETLVKDYCLMFKRHSNLNVRCILVTLHSVKDSANYHRLKNSGVEIISIYENHNKFVSLHRKLFGLFYVPNKLYKIIKKYSPTAIHIHLGLLKYLIPISGKIKNIKLFYTCHSEPSIKFGNNDGEFQAARFLIANNKLQIIGLHEDMRIQLNNMFNIDNTIVLNNGIDFSVFKGVKGSKEDIRKSLNIHSDSFVVGHIGRFSPVKNHIFLIKVFAKLLEVKKNSILLLIGNGPTKDSVLQEAKKLRIHDKIIFLSNRTDIPELLKCMDVFVFPSLFEGLSVTLVEAQVSGLRCVISDKIKPYNILTDKTVQLSLDDSFGIWCEAIMNNELRNTYYYDISKFDLELVITELAEIYKNN